jgi:hypothetical protein
MTTRIHIVNFGPDVVKVDTPTTAPTKEIWPGQYADFFVYPSNELTITEKKSEQEPKQ